MLCAAVLPLHLRSSKTCSSVLRRSPSTTSPARRRGWRRCRKWCRCERCGRCEEVWTASGLHIGVVASPHTKCIPCAVTAASCAMCCYLFAHDRCARKQHQPVRRCGCLAEPSRFPPSLPLSTQGVATFTVSSPALLMASEPSAISDQVRSRSDTLSQPAKRTRYVQQSAWGCSTHCGTQSNSQHMRVTVLPTLMPLPGVCPPFNQCPPFH